MTQEEMRQSLIIGKDTQELCFQKTLLTKKINKQNKPMIFANEKWMREDQNNDKKK
jgi:hypothetical protein